MLQMNPPDSREFYDLLMTHMNDGDIKDLCFFLKIPYEDLAGNTKRDKCRELILHCERLAPQKYRELWEEFLKLRPNIFRDVYSEIQSGLSLIEKLSKAVESRRQSNKTFRITQNIIEEDSYLAGINLSGKDVALFGLNLSGYYFAEAILDEAVLAESNLENAYLQGASLKRTKLYRAILRHANLEGANLSGANLEGANLTDVKIKKADLSGAILSDAILTNADLTGAILSEAKLERVRLEDAILENTNLSNADLEGANLQRGNLHGADLAGANLRRANLLDAQVSNAQLRLARNLQEAILPNGQVYIAEKQTVFVLNLSESEKIPDEIRQEVYGLYPNHGLIYIDDLLLRGEDDEAEIISNLRSEIEKIGEKHPTAWYTGFFTIYIGEKLSSLFILYPALAELHKHIGYFPLLITSYIQAPLDEDAKTIEWISAE